MEQRPKNPQLSAGIVEALPNEDCLKILQEPQNYVDSPSSTTAAAIPAATTVDETVPLPSADNKNDSAVAADDDDESSDGEL